MYCTNQQPPWRESCELAGFSSTKTNKLLVGAADCQRLDRLFLVSHWPIFLKQQRLSNVERVLHVRAHTDGCQARQTSLTTDSGSTSQQTDKFKSTLLSGCQFSGLWGCFWGQRACFRAFFQCHLDVRRFRQNTFCWNSSSCPVFLLHSLIQQFGREEATCQTSQALQSVEFGKRWKQKPSVTCAARVWACACTHTCVRVCVHTLIYEPVWFCFFLFDLQPFGSNIKQPLPTRQGSHRINAPVFYSPLGRRRRISVLLRLTGCFVIHKAAQLIMSNHRWRALVIPANLTAGLVNLTSAGWAANKQYDRSLVGFSPESLLSPLTGKFRVSSRWAETRCTTISGLSLEAEQSLRALQNHNWLHTFIYIYLPSDNVVAMVCESTAQIRELFSKTCFYLLCGE